MKVSTINISLIILTLLILTIIAWIIYLNRGSDQIIGITIKSFLIPVIAGAGLLFIEFTKPIENYEEEIHIGLADDPQIMMALYENNNSDIHNGLMKYMMLLHKIKLGETNQKLNDLDLQNFIQVYILDMMSQRYSLHWDSNNDKNNWFFGNSSSTIYTKEYAEKKPLKITFADLKKENKDNLFLHKMNDSEHFYVPSGSKIKLSKNFNNFILIETDNIEMTFSITNKSFTLFPYAVGNIAEKFKLKIGEKKNYFYGTTLKLNANPKRIKRWSPNTLKEMEWAKDFGQHLIQNISWEGFTNSN